MVAVDYSGFGQQRICHGKSIDSGIRPSSGLYKKGFLTLNLVDEATNPLLSPSVVVFGGGRHLPRHSGNLCVVAVDYSGFGQRVCAAQTPDGARKGRY